MHRRFGRATAPLAAVAITSIAAAASVAVAAPPISAPPGFERGNAAVARIGDRLPALAAEHGLNPGELRRMLLDDDTLAVDASLELAYFDEAEPEPDSPEPDSPEPDSLEPALVARAVDGAVAAPPTTGPEFQLASLPGADKTIYLDFDGHITEGTSWNAAYGVTTIVSPPYDLDGSPDTWSATELDRIAQVWAAVAEDFAPWNVNVTTIDPGTDALRRYGSGDTQWGARVVITDDTFANCGCGGHAYIGAFDDTTDEPTFVYNSSFTGVAEAASHEVGHMLLLYHDGTLSGAAYYRGHNSADTPSWGPIMGAAYNLNISQWSKQEYYDANNTNEDDIAIISSLTNGNGMGVRTDDHGDNLAAATPLSVPTVDEAGLIATRDDVDAFSFSTLGGATVNVAANVAAVRPNLDIQLVVRNSSGTVVASNNASTALNASLNVYVGPGSYTIEVDGVGVGTPSANPPSGYTDYGSLGQYTLTGTITGAEEPDSEPPAAPSGLSGTEIDTTAVLTWQANTEPDLAGYVVQRDDGTGFADLGATGLATAYTDAAAPSGAIDYRVVAVDVAGNRSAPSNVVTVTIPVRLTQSVTSETTTFGTVSGTFAATTQRGGATQTIVEVDSGGKPQRRFDRAEHTWTLPASQGNQTLTVVASASDGGDADNGFAFEWSADGVTWIPLTTVRAGSPVDTTFDIGAPTGTLRVRVVDTDRSVGERRHDSVTVDFLQVTGDGAVVEPPTATTAVASITTSQQSAGRGQQYGVATVTVRNDLGAPVVNAAVTVRFSGSFSETVSGTTNSSGSVTFVTSTSSRKAVVDACVGTLTQLGGLTYLPGTEAC